MFFVRFIKNYWLLILLFFLALFLRTYNLQDIPAGLHGDEASIGYNAYSLLKTNHDQNGNLFPLAIDQFGDFRPAGYHYLDIPFVAFMGLNEWAVRLPAAIFGAATIIIFYFLLKEILGSKKMALAGAGLLTISPWHIVISRATSESVIAMFFVILGITLFLKGIKTYQKIPTFFLASSLFFSLSFLFYHSARFFVPIFIIFLFTISYLYFKPAKRTILHAGGLFIIIILFLFFLLKYGGGTARPFDISIFHMPGGNGEIKQQTDEDGTQNPLISRFYHNKLFFYSKNFFVFYFRHLSGEFFFINNGNPVRYRVPWFGNLYPVEAPFLIFGFAVLFAEGIKRKKYHYLIPVAWFFIAAIPGGLTWEDTPNIQRVSLMIFPLIMMTIMGVKELFNLCNTRLKILIFLPVSLVFLQNILSFNHNYYYHSRIHEPWYRSASEKELILTVNDLSKKYNQIIMTTNNNNNFIFYLFYSAFDPKLFQKMGSPKEKDGLRFQNLTYVSNPCPLEGQPGTNLKGDKNIIYINGALDNCKLPLNVEKLKTTYTPDGIPTYEILKLTDEIKLEKDSLQ